MLPLALEGMNGVKSTAGKFLSLGTEYCLYGQANGSLAYTLTKLVGRRLYVQISRIDEAKNDLILSEKDAWSPPESLYNVAGKVSPSRGNTSRRNC
ncbi:hypothetical protein CK203_034557 [Vitis vinifera]|uniref:Uncharacterized protein n=1 Tax=Vitis vinifera TaxID=29760 RepID=A0A438IDU6_VITVI|nr:hypothetical protein CK203_034557 [Vitis vinifera]